MNRTRRCSWYPPSSAPSSRLTPGLFTTLEFISTWESQGWESQVRSQPYHSSLPGNPRLETLGSTLFILASSLRLILGFPKHLFSELPRLFRTKIIQNHQKHHRYWQHYKCHEKGIIYLAYSHVLPHIVCICTVLLVLANRNSARYMKWTGM